MGCVFSAVDNRTRLCGFRFVLSIRNVLFTSAEFSIMDFRNNQHAFNFYPHHFKREVLERRMNLLDIKQYLIQVKITSLSTLATHFQCDTERMRCMLMHWVNKGRVRCLKKTPACGGSCFKCA